MSTLHAVELGVLGPLQVRRDGGPVVIPGAKPRAILTMLGLHGGSVVAADTLLELLWGDDPPRTAAKALQTHISSLRRALGDGFVLTEGTGWILTPSETDASRYRAATRMGRDAAAAGDTGQAVARFEEALSLWRGTPELPDTRRGISEKTRWVEGHAALVEDRADALLSTGRAAEVIGELEAAVADAPLRERRWGQLMLALYRAGRQGEALAAYQRARSLLAEELGVDPGPELRRLEGAIVAQDPSLETPVTQQLSSVMRAVTFLLTDIEGSTAAWEANADAMARALARHDELVEQIVTSRGGKLIKTRGEGDATFSVFERPSGAAAAAMELQDAITDEPWALMHPMRIRIALHTGEVELRDGDYFGRAVNRAARLRSLAAGGQILCSGATAELVIDSLPEDVMLTDLGMRQLKNLPRPEHVFELRLDTAIREEPSPTSDAPFERPALPAVLTGPGQFVGRGSELERLLGAWQAALADGVRTVLIAGEPGVGKTRLAGEWSQRAYEQGAIVLYGRCDEDLGVSYQPFAEALRSLVPCVDASRLRGLRGVEALLPLVSSLIDVLPDLVTAARADPDTERLALFDAVVALLELASARAPIVLVLDDLHWAAKPTLLLLRHLLRFGDHARVQIVGTYRSTDLDRSHPLAAMLADLHRDGTADRLNLSGLDGNDVTEYVAGAGYDDEDLANALASVTGGNPFFLIEALRHVDESGGVWDPSTLPQGVREAVSRRLSRLPAETNKALAAAAVVGSRFALDLVEHVVGDELIDAFDEASKAGIVIEEPGGYYRFNHALVRQSLLAELASVRRMRLHQRIATTLEAQPGADEELLAELAHHYFECAWAGNATKAVEYCRRAADQAMARLAYEGAADLYDRALHALEEIDDELPDRDEQAAELLIARCEALLAAGDVASANGAVSRLRDATLSSARLGGWAACFEAQLSVLIHPERLDEAEIAVGAAAAKLAELDDAAGEAKAHTVHAGCLARLGRIADCEVALDDALTAARRARDHRLVNAVLANAPLAALWGPNPVPRAGGRCLDVVRLLRITTDSPAVEATSTRCQAVLEAFRGRQAAARRMIDSARRAITELGLRHALLEVEQFAGIVELIADDAAAAEPYLRKAYNGFRRMGLDADTAETAALLGRACLTLDRNAAAEELCTESERLAGHALKASIAWRTLRAQLLSRSNDHGEATRIAEAAVRLAERTDLLVDHGDACATLATVLERAGNAAGARSAAERAVDLYERKGAAALADIARRVVGERKLPAAPPPTEVPALEFDTACVRVGDRVMAAIEKGSWDEFEQLFAPEAVLESRRKIVGFTKVDLTSGNAARAHRRTLESGETRFNAVVIAVRGERLALSRFAMATADAAPGAPQDEFLQIYGIDEDGRVALQVWFDLEDMAAALAELEATHARFEEEPRQARRFESALTSLAARFSACFAARDWVAMAVLFADDVSVEDRRRTVNAGIRHGRDATIEDLRTSAEVGFTDMTSVVMATRGGRLSLNRVSICGQRPDELVTEVFHVVEIDADEKFAAAIIFDLNDLDAAIAELDSRYLTGEAAPHARTWSMIAESYAALGRQEVPAIISPSAVFVDHRRAAAFGSTDLMTYIRAGYDLGQHIRPYIETVHRLTGLGAVCGYAAQGVSDQGFNAEWRGISLATARGDRINHCEFFDEDDLDAALAKFDELSRPAALLENAASRHYERFKACYAARDLRGITELLTDNFFSEDRRRVVNSGIRRGKDAVIEEATALAELDIEITTDVVATRGERLVLNRVQISTHDQGPDAFNVIGLDIVEIDADDRTVARIVFDLDDFDAAITELDARYIAGEAEAHANAWSVIAGGYAAINRHELPTTTQDFASIDHRRGATFAPGDLKKYLRAGWDLDQDITLYVESVHRLSDVGAVCTHVAHGVSHAGFTAEWRGIDLLTVDGARANRFEYFDENDLDAALARFDQLSPARHLENAASRLYGRFKACYAARDWSSVREMLADNVLSDDRRRPINSGIHQGPDPLLREISELAKVGIDLATEVLATRGERLVLSRLRTSRHDQGPDGFGSLDLDVVELGPDGRFVARIVFNLDDIDAAFAELDARYIAGEGAAYARTWSVITGVFAAHNRREILTATPDVASIDHRRVAAFAPGEGVEYIRAGWDLDQTLNIYIEKLHRVTDLGAVFTWTGFGSSHDGFDAEWRGINLMTVDGEMLKRGEVFDEDDLDAALARFDQLSRSAPRPENAPSRLWDRIKACYATRDWQAIADLLADNVYTDDRRRPINSGQRHGVDAVIAEGMALAHVGIDVSSEVVAVRGERLVLNRVRTAGSDQGPDGFGSVDLDVLEIGPDGRVVARIVFNLDDIDAAFEELDGRYLAGEAAAHAHAWSAVRGCYAALNRRELPATTTNHLGVDHRRGTTPFAPGDVKAYTRAAWSQIPDISFRIEAVHQLSDLGAVITQALRGASQEGFEAEWREIHLMTIEGDLFNRSEFFDETDLDAAITRFEQLNRSVPRLQNAATQAYERMWCCFETRDWDAITELVADNEMVDDRRRVGNAGLRRGRNAGIEELQAAADIGFTITMVGVVATRGDRLALTRVRASGRDPQAVQNDAFNVVQIDADRRIAEVVVFDLDDFDTAMRELDRRYLAGEGATYEDSWSVIAEAYAALNRGEFPATSPDFIDIDHRPLAAIGSGDLMAYLGAALEDAPRSGIYVEAIHRMTDFGGVITHVAKGTSREGFDAEWRIVSCVIVDGEKSNRVELFDEADLDAALARFDELYPRFPRLKNAAAERFLEHFAARDWDALAQDFAETYYCDDRRRVVNAGLRQGRDAAIEDLQVTSDIGLTTTATVDIIATRGERCILTHWHGVGPDPGASQHELLQVVEHDADERVAAAVIFDVDDIDAATEELDARYLAGEAAPHARTWSAIAGAYAAMNRHELFPTTPDWLNVDHRRPRIIEEGGLNASLLSMWQLVPDVRFEVEVVHRLTGLGAVCSHVAHGVSRDGFKAEWRGIEVQTVDGDLISGCEIFDETDLDAALARFEELQPRNPRLENAASRAHDRFFEYFRTRNWAAIAEILTEGSVVDDRHDVVNSGFWDGRDAVLANLRALADAAPTTSTVVATRGERLALSRMHSPNRDQQYSDFSSDMLIIAEVDADGRIAAQLSFHVDDADVAFKELDDRYRVGEPTAYARTWSVIAEAYASFNQHEVPATATASVAIEHRPLLATDAVDLAAAIRAVWELTPDASIYIEAVHRLSELGAVVTYALRGVSHDHFEVEWRMVGVFTVEGDRIGHCDVFDEADLLAALARFEELRPQAPRPENLASKTEQRFQACFATRDWDALAELLSDDISIDDRRRVVNAGVRHGRDAEIVSWRAIADVGVTNITPTVVAVRGRHLALNCYSIVDGWSGSKVLCVSEVDAENRLVARVAFDPNDIDAAFAELDARFLAGVPAACKRTWSVITEVYAAYRRNELPALDWINVDHRRATPFATTSELTAVIRAWRDLTPEFSMCIPVVHRLNTFGAVITHVSSGTSQDGLNAEWRMIQLLTVDGGRINRCELFDEEDLDAALARFEALQPRGPRLQNSASRAGKRFLALFAASEWGQMAEMLAEDFLNDDRRQVVGAGLQHGRDAQIADMRTVAELWSANVTSTVIATRGERLTLMRLQFSAPDHGSEAFLTEALGVLEIDAEEQIAAVVFLDPNDIDAAFEELDARYLAGEAAAHGHTWSLVAVACAAMNRHELLATTQDCVNVDHRRGLAFAPGDMTEYLRSVVDITPDFSHYIEAVHRLSNTGVVATYMAHGTSQDGFDAEWRVINVLMFKSNAIDRLEIFAEDDLDAAVARFDELGRPARTQS